MMALAGLAVGAASGCATGAPGATPSPTGGPSARATTSVDGGRHVEPPPGPAVDACATCSEPDDAGAIGPDDASGGPADDAGDTLSPGDAAPQDDGSGASPPFTFPPIDWPDAGLGAPSGPDDGGDNACTSKICIDPVFDCPLQGCFNGCTNFHCT